MKLSQRTERIYKYGSKLYSDTLIDQVIELFYTSKENSCASIGQIVNLKPSQVLGILNRYDDNVIKFERQRK